MARYKRIYYSRAVYHVTARGNNRQKILQSNKDKESFLKTLNKHKDRYNFRLYGFVLMDNHIHLVIETNSYYNIFKVMQSILLSYSIKFRRLYKYIGHVWQGRFKSNPIGNEAYFHGCLEYIHNNPVRAEVVNDPQDYPWSSFCFYQPNIQIYPSGSVLHINNNKSFGFCVFFENAYVRLRVRESDFRLVWNMISVVILLNRNTLQINTLCGFSQLVTRVTNWAWGWKIVKIGKYHLIK